MENSIESRYRNIEIILYLVAFLLAVALRFIQLGALPMGDLEANNALQALNLARGTPVIVGGQPAYEALTSILFFLFGSTEFWARFWPATFGVAVIFLPLLFRKWLGTIPSLILALFLAIEPGFIALSRTSTGTMIGLVSLIAAFGFLFNLKPIQAGIFAGIALLGGTTFWPGLIGIFLSYGIFSLAQTKRSEINSFPSLFKSGLIDWKSFFISAGFTVALMGTVFLFRPNTISGLGTSIVGYFQSWAKIGAGVSIPVMLTGLMGGELLAILLAFYGAATGWRKHPELNFFLGVWAIVSVLLTLLNPSRQVVDWVWTLIPLWVLAAFGLGDLIQLLSSKEWLLKFFQTIATVALLVFSYLNLLSMIEGQAVHTSLQLLAIVLPLALLVIITFLIGWGWSTDASRQGLIIGIGFLLVMVAFGSAWKAAGLGPRPEAELWRSDVLPVGRDLTMKTIRDLSLWNTGQVDGIDVALLRQNQPSFQWALRDFSKMSYKDILGVTETPSIVISSTNDALSLTQSYRGQELVWFSGPDFGKMTAKNWIEWFAFRDVPLKETDILIWARNDLFKGS